MASPHTMPDVTDYLSGYTEGLELFNQGRFWHAHEAWEAIWLEADGVQSQFYQGLIQLAGACFHLNRSNWSGANRLLHFATANLLPAAPSHLGVDVDGLLEKIDQLLEEVHQVRHRGKPCFDGALIPELTRS